MNYSRDLEMTSMSYSFPAENILGWEGGGDCGSIFKFKKVQTTQNDKGVIEVLIL